MKSLYDVLNENRLEAIEKLKKFGNTLEFNYDEENDIDEIKTSDIFKKSFILFLFLAP